MHNIALWMQETQTEARAIIAEHTDARFFMRQPNENHSLWVSDLPRRTDAFTTEAAMRSLRAHGFPCECHASSRLLAIDLSLERYDALLNTLPQVPPPMPADDRLHPAYALCRLLLLHPSPLSAQPLAPLRLLLHAAPEIPFDSLPALHRECAAWLRAGQPLPHAAGQVLATLLSTNGG